MKFSGNAHNIMPYIQVTFFKRSSNSCARGMRLKYNLARIDNDYFLKFRYEADKCFTAPKYIGKDSYELWANWYYQNAHKELLNTS